jgi:hypothetical protein
MTTCNRVTDVTGGFSVEAVAAFIRLHRRVDRGELLRAILAKWPDLSGDELQRALNTRPSGRRVLVLRQTNERSDVETAEQA